MVKGAFTEELKKKATRQKRAKKGAIIGGGIAMADLLKDYNIKFNNDGSVTLEK